MSLDYSSYADFEDRSDYYQTETESSSKNNKSSTTEESLQRSSKKRIVIVSPPAQPIGWIATANTENIEPVVDELIKSIDFKYGASSILETMIFSEEYLAVIGIGPRAVPILLKHLQHGSIPWFWALKAIVRTDIAADCRPGDFKGVRDAWLEWGKMQGLL